MGDARADRGRVRKMSEKRGLGEVAQTFRIITPRGVSVVLIELGESTWPQRQREPGTWYARSRPTDRGPDVVGEL